jgi:hypothetical protein
VAASCLPGGDAPSSTGGDGATTGAGDGSSTPTTEDLRPCRTSIASTPAASPDAPSVERMTGTNPSAASVSISQGAFVCAHDVVVVASSDLDRVAIASRLAVDLGGPLLFSSGGGSSLLAYEIDRLSPETVWIVGDGTTVQVPDFTEVQTIHGDDDEIATTVNDRIDAQSSVTLPATPGIATVVAAVSGFVDGFGLTPTPTTTTTSAAAGTTEPATTTTTAATTTTETREAVPSLYAGAGTSGTVWLIDVADPELALAAAASAATTGGLMAVVDGTDLRKNTEVARTLQLISGGVRRAQLIGVTPDATWQLPVILQADEIPGGGYLMFPGRRLVALYGNPQTSDLGVLGEQDFAGSVARVRQASIGYDADGLQVLPTFEIIATVASADAGFDGNYSNEMTVDFLRPWIEGAAREGMYVLLDLQPGRTDFLTQAKLYEELLLEPNVGLALDPEWRLGPDEFHLRQIGHVSAEEVNSVVEWLADLVRQHHLPQKMLLLHQFRVSMLENRDQIETPSELAVVIQMDGQGAISDKYSTWGIITQGWETAAWRFGWKNFYDEDSPGPLSPSEVLDLVPTVVYVSYQ